MQEDLGHTFTRLVVFWLFIASDAAFWRLLVDFSVHGAQISHYNWSRLSLPNHLSIFLFQNCFVVPKHGSLICPSNSLHGGWIFRYYGQLVLHIFRSLTKKVWLAYLRILIACHRRQSRVKTCNSNAKSTSSAIQLVWRVKSFIGGYELA